MKKTVATIIGVASLILAFQPEVKSEKPPLIEDGHVVYARIPVFDLKREQHVLEIGLSERVYEEPIYKNILEIPTEQFPAAERVLVGYLQHLHAGQEDQARAFYQNGKPSPGMAGLLEIVKGYVQKAASISLMKTWYFGPYQETLIRLTYADGSSDTLALSAQKIEGRYYRVDTFDDAGDVLGLWAYMGVNLKKGLDTQHESRSFAHAIKLKPPDVLSGGPSGHPLMLYVDGTLHLFRQDWQRVEEIEASDPAVDFVHRFFATAAEGSDQDFLDLISGKEGARVKTLLEEEPDHFAGYRRFYLAESIKDVFTMDLGAYAVHYYFRWDRGNQMQTIIFAVSDGNYGLSEDLYTNVRSFVESDRVKKAIERMWLRQAVPEHADYPSAQDPESEVIRAFEENLYNRNAGSKFYNSVVPRPDVEKLGEFVLQGVNVKGNLARLIYHVEDPEQDERTWGSRIKTYAIGMEKMNGIWTVVSTNVTPGEQLEYWKAWLDEL